MQAAPSGTPWLENVAQQGGPVQKSLLTSFPFSIGRNDDTDLPIKSTRVSREHALIIRAGQTYRIRDLDSTNGTLVNGQRIEEATLCDGDIVVIADVEFTFFAGAAQAPRKTVTQVIGFHESDVASLKSQDLIRSLRRWQETVLQGSQTVIRRPVIELDTRDSIGVEVRAGSSLLATEEPDSSVLLAHTRLALRLRAAFLLLAAEAARQAGVELYVPLDAADLDPGVTEQCLDVLACAQNLDTVVLELPDSAVNDIAYFQDWYRRLKARGVRLCYADFAAGKPQLEVHRKMPPDYVRLSRTFARGVLKDRDRQTQLQTMLNECRRIGCEVIVPELLTEPDALLWSRLGCRYAVGDDLNKDAVADQRYSADSPRQAQQLMAAAH